MSIYAFKFYIFGLNFDWGQNYLVRNATQFFIKLEMESTGTNTPMSAVFEPIDAEYEYIQYNEKLRLIHSINDDMYQMQ